MKNLNYQPGPAVKNNVFCLVTFAALVLLSLLHITPASAIGPEWKIFTPVYSFNKGAVTLDKVVKTKAISDVVCGNDGTVWIACEDSYPVSIKELDKKEFRIVAGNPAQFQAMNYVPSANSEFVKCGNGQVWLITGQNILCLKDTLSEWEGINIVSGKKSAGNFIPPLEFDVLGDIQADKNGNIWVTGVSKTKVKAGLAVLSGDKWIYYAAPQELIDVTIAPSTGKKIQLISGGGEMAYAKSPELQTLFSDLSFDSDDNLWMKVGRNNDRGICKFSKGEFRLFNVKNSNLSSDMIMDVAADMNGVIHFATEKGLFVVNPGDKLSAFKQGYTPVAMTFDAANKLWWSSPSPTLPTSPVLNRYDVVNEGEFVMTPNNTPLSDEVKKIYSDENNNMYFITSDKAHGLYILFNGQQSSYPGWRSETSFLSGSKAMDRYSLTAGLTDKDRNFYGISEFNGRRHLNILKDGAWEQSPFTLANDSKGLLSGGYTVNAIAKDNKGNVYLGTTNYMYKYDNTATSVEGYDKSKISKTVNCMASDQAGNIWVGTTKGLSKYDGAQFTYFDTKTSLLPGNQILNLLTDKRDRVWVGTPDGLLCIDKDKQTVYDKKNGLKTQRIVGLAQDNNGKVFIATSNFNSQSESLYIEENGSLTMEPLPDIYTIGSMVFDRNDNLWISCENTLLCRTKEGKYVVYNSKNSALLHAYNIERLFSAGDEIWLIINESGNVSSGSSYSSRTTQQAAPAPISKETEILNSLRPRLTGLEPGHFTLVFRPGV